MIHKNTQKKIPAWLLIRQKLKTEVVGDCDNGAVEFQTDQISARSIDQSTRTYKRYLVTGTLGKPLRFVVAHDIKMTFPMLVHMLTCSPNDT